MQKQNLHEELLNLVRGLGYSEALAYQRKASLKICKAVPEIKSKIDQGSLSLTTLARANKVLATKNTSEKRTLLSELENKSSREVDKILAREWPLTDSRYSSTPGPAKRYVNEQTVRVTLDLTEQEFQNLERLKALKSHQVSDLKDLINLLVDKELEKYNRTSKIKSRSLQPRQIKITLKNYLLQKAQYRCQFPGCQQTHFLQVDHIRPVKSGGTNDPENLRILCQAHNLSRVTGEALSRQK